MKKLYELVDNIHDKETMLKIIRLFEPKIKKSSRFITYSEQEDIEQELRIEMIKEIQRFDTSNIPGFFEFLERANSEK